MPTGREVMDETLRGMIQKELEDKPGIFSTRYYTPTTSYGTVRMQPYTVRAGAGPKGRGRRSARERKRRCRGC